MASPWATFPKKPFHRHAPQENDGDSRKGTDGSGLPLQRAAMSRSPKQIVQTIRLAESGTPVAELCRKIGISEQTFWKRVRGPGPRTRRLKQLGEEPQAEASGRRPDAGQDHAAGCAAKNVKPGKKGARRWRLVQCHGQSERQSAAQRRVHIKTRPESAADSPARSAGAASVRQALARSFAAGRLASERQAGAAALQAARAQSATESREAREKCGASGSYALPGLKVVYGIRHR